MSEYGGAQKKRAKGGERGHHQQWEVGALAVRALLESVEFYPLFFRAKLALLS